MTTLNSVNNNLAQPTSTNSAAPQSMGSWWDKLIAYCKEAVTKVEADVKAVVEEGIKITQEAPGVIGNIEKEATTIGTEVETALSGIQNVLSSALKFLQNNEFLAQILGPNLEAKLQNIFEEGINLTDKAETDVADAVKALPKYASELDNVFAEIQQFLSGLDQKL
jgi:exonuclease VII small subunit